MRKRFSLVALTVFGIASAQPAYFSRFSVRDDIAKRVGAFEASCSEISAIPRDDAPYASCLFLKGDSDYIKSIIDIYYREYYSGGWKLLSSNTIYNFIRKDGNSLEIKLIEAGEFTIVSVYDMNAQTREATEVARQRIAAQESNKLNSSGATPDSAYIRLVDMQNAGKINYTNKSYSLIVNGIRLDFSPGTRDAKLNGVVAKLNATPFILDGTMFIPLAAIKMFGCTYEAPSGGSVAFGCGETSTYTFVDIKLAKTKNPPPGQLMYTAVKPIVAPPATTGTRPASSPSKTPIPQGAIPEVAYVKLDDISTLGSLSFMANGGTALAIQDKQITFIPSNFKTVEGMTLEGAPFYLEADKDLVIPLNSLKSIGCAVLINGSQFAVTCPNGSSVEGEVLRW